MREKRKVISFRISEDLNDKLEKISTKTKKNKSDIARYFFETQINELDKIKDDETENIKIENKLKTTEKTIENMSYIETKIQKAIEEGIKNGTSELAKKLSNLSIAENKRYYIFKKSIEKHFEKNYGVDALEKYEEKAHKAAILSLRNSEEYKYIVGSIYKDFNYLLEESEMIDRTIREAEEKAKRQNSDIDIT